MKSDTCGTVWKCTHCDKEFKYESEKRRHEQSHVPQFECKVCSKKFSFVSALRRHEKQHERKESVQCNKCGRKFRDDTLLKRHIQYAHKGTFICKKCNTSLNSEIALHTHMKIHKPESERRFHCSYKGCSKTFNFIHHLKHHELTHTDDKPHVCTECGKRFIQLHHLKMHQRVHKPDSWLQCPVPECHKEFTNEYALKRHVATHSNKSRKSKRSAKNISENIKKEGGQSSNNAIKFNSEQLLKSIPDIFDHVEYASETVEVKKPKDHIVGREFDMMDLASANNFETSDNFEEFGNQMGNVDENVDIDDIDMSISNCKSIIGKCIVTGDTEGNESCLCAQMSTKNEHDDCHKVIPISNKPVNIKFVDDLKCIEKRRNDVNACENCECASICGIKDKSKINNIELETPELELRNDNVIKIKDAFDIDIDEKSNYDKESKGDLDLKVNVNIMNSCRDVIGNCIVSGDGTMGEGCLCARMTADDQAITQEIEEIMPRPNITWSKQNL